MGGGGNSKKMPESSQDLISFYQAGMNYFLEGHFDN